MFFFLAAQKNWATGSDEESVTGVSLQEAAAVTLVFEGNRAEVNLQKKD